MSHYKPYPAYRDSGVEWIGEVPEHWDIARIKRTSSLRTDRCTEATEGSQYIGLEDVEAGTGQYRPTEGSARQNEDSTVGVFKTGDVLYGKLRPYLKKAIVSDADGVCSTEFLVLQPKTVLAPWLHQWLLTTGATQQIEAGCEGSKMPRADWEHVGSIHVPSPDATEQAEIIAVLDRETKRIDSLISKKTRFIELLKEKRQALITHAVTKGLDPKVKMRDSGVEWIGEVPEHWQAAPMKFVARLESGHTPSRKVPAYWENCTVPWFTLADIWQVRKAGRIEITETSEMVSDLGLMNSSARKLPKGTVILSRTASVGFPAILGCEMATSQDFAAWICGARLNNQYLYRCLVAMRGELSRLMMGSTHKTIYMPDIEGFRCPLPPIAEQLIISKFIEAQSQRFADLIEKTQHSIDLLKERRSAFITAAVTGQIDLRESA